MFHAIGMHYNTTLPNAFWPETKTMKSKCGPKRNKRFAIETDVKPRWLRLTSRRLTWHAANASIMRVKQHHHQKTSHLWQMFLYRAKDKYQKQFIFRIRNRSQMFLLHMCVTLLSIGPHLFQTENWWRAQCKHTSSAKLLTRARVWPAGLHLFDSNIDTNKREVKQLLVQNLTDAFLLPFRSPAALQ